MGCLRRAAHYHEITLPSAERACVSLSGRAAASGCGERLSCCSELKRTNHRPMRADHIAIPHIHNDHPHSTAHSTHHSTAQRREKSGQITRSRHSTTARSTACAAHPYPLHWVVQLPGGDDEESLGGEEAQPPGELRGVEAVVEEAVRRRRAGSEVRRPRALDLGARAAGLLLVDVPKVALVAVVPRRRRALRNSRRTLTITELLRLSRFSGGTRSGSLGVSPWIPQQVLSATQGYTVARGALRWTGAVITGQCVESARQGWRRGARSSWAHQPR